jgi:hypothetical protein
MTRPIRDYYVAALMLLLMVCPVSAQPSSLRGDYVCVVDAAAALVLGEDHLFHAVIPALSTEEKTLSMSVKANPSYLSPHYGCPPHEASLAVTCFATNKMTIKRNKTFNLEFWSDPSGYLFHDYTGGVMQMHKDYSFAWAEAIAEDNHTSFIRRGRCNRVTH